MVYFESTIKWYISDNSLLYPRCHACSIEPSLVDNLLLKMQNPVSRRQRNDVKRGSGKMCLHVLQRQFKIFKIPKCLSKIKNFTPHFNNLLQKTSRKRPGKIFKFWRKKLVHFLQSMHKFRFLLRNIFQNAVRQFQTYLRFGNSCQSRMKNEENQKQKNYAKKKQEKAYTAKKFWQRAIV